MIATLATALALLLGHAWLAGAAADLDPTLLPAAAAVLLAGAGLGLAWRRTPAAGPSRRGGALMPALLLAVLAVLRGPLCDLVFRLGTPDVATALVAAVVSLGPAGFCLGRVLGPSLDGSLPLVMLGAGLGQLLALLGATDILPSTVGALLIVALLWLLGRAAAARAAAREPAATGAPAEPTAVRAHAARLPWHALLIGGAMGLLLLALRRVVPAYVAPGAHAGADTLLALCLPAALVAWPAAVLAGEGWSRRIVAAVGGVLLAVAAATTAGSLDLYENAAAQVALTRQLHLHAVRWAPLLGDWWVWLLSFAGVVAAALGVACGAVRGRRGAGLFLIGGGLAAAAEQWLMTSEGHAVTAPAGMVLAASGLAALSAALALLPRAGWLLLPLVAVPFLKWPEPGEDLLGWRTPPDFTAVRRPGEYGVDAFQRSVLADVTVFSTPGPDSHAIEGREAWRFTCTDRMPVVSLTPDGKLRVALSGVEGAAGAEPERHEGVRLGGIAMHAGHEPLGDEGSVGRLTRLFAVQGREFVTGTGSELIAADLHDAGSGESAFVSSAIPIGRTPLRVMLDALGTEGWQAGIVAGPVFAARQATPASFDSVIVAPSRSGWVGAGAMACEEHVQRLAELLRPGGRCLLWLDTTDLSGRALQARCAAFAHVFGERSAAFVEMRELDAPFVLLLGWRDDAGQLQAEALSKRLPWPDATGQRSRLAAIEDAGAMLLRDGAGMVACGWAASTRERSFEASLAGRGWQAVADLRSDTARLSTVVAGAPDVAHRAEELFLGLAAHTRYAYDLADVNETLLEIKPDVDWAAFDAEAAHYARAASADGSNPLLHQALAALLEPLAMSGDYGRFARVYQECGVATMASWRLALLESWVAQSSLEQEQAAAALARAVAIREGATAR